MLLTIEVELSDQSLKEINRYDTKNNMSAMTYNATCELLEQAFKV